MAGSEPDGPEVDEETPGTCWAWVKQWAQTNESDRALRTRLRWELLSESESAHYGKGPPCPAGHFK